MKTATFTSTTQNQSQSGTLFGSTASNTGGSLFPTAASASGGNLFSSFKTPQKSTSAFGAAPSFGGAPTFGSPPSFGGAPTFGSSTRNYRYFLIGYKFLFK